MPDLPLLHCSSRHCTLGYKGSKEGILLLPCSLPCFAFCCSISWALWLGGQSLRKPLHLAGLSTSQATSCTGLFCSYFGVVAGSTFLSSWVLFFASGGAGDALGSPQVWQCCWHPVHVSGQETSIWLCGEKTPQLPNGCSTWKVWSLVEFMQLEEPGEPTNPDFTWAAAVHCDEKSKYELLTWSNDDLLFSYVIITNSIIQVYPPNIHYFVIPIVHLIMSSKNLENNPPTLTPPTAAAQETIWGYNVKTKKAMCLTVL